jgi:hypothetical protein
VHRVFADGLEAQFGAEELAVERVGVAGECGGAEGEDGDTGVELPESGEVGEEGLSVGEEVVGPSDGLGALPISGAREPQQAQDVPEDGCIQGG